MLLRTKAEYISSYNEDGQFRKVTLEFLLRTVTFCDAEKATLAILVTGINSYSVEPDMKAPDTDNDVKWFEIHVQVKEMKDYGGHKFKVYKYLKQAEDVTHAEKLIASELASGNLFEDFKVIKVIGMNFKEVIA